MGWAGLGRRAPSHSLNLSPLSRRCGRRSEWEFEVTAFYRGRQVFQQTIFCPKGLRLVGSEAGDKALPGQVITLPDPGVSLTDRTVTGYVKRVLGSLGGGLALWKAGQWLWAQRLGHCHTYWAMGEELLPTSGHGPDGEVPKDREGGVFDLKPFVAGECGGVLAWEGQGPVLKSLRGACRVLLFDPGQRTGLLGRQVWGLSPLSPTCLELMGGSARCTKGAPGTSCQRHYYQPLWWLDRRRSPLRLS